MHTLLKKELQNNTKITKTTKTKDGINIGTWLDTQRSLHKNKKLHKNRELMLLSLGIKLQVNLNSAEIQKRNLEYIKEFISKNGLESLVFNTVYKDVKIGVWVADQRNRGNEDIKAKLSTYGLDMIKKDTLSKDGKLKILKEFITLNGLDSLRKNTIYKDTSIGSMVHKDKGLYNKDKLDKKIHDKYIAIHKDILLSKEEKIKIEWNNNYLKLQNYLNEDNLLINLKDKEHKAIYTWLNFQRKKNTLKELTKERKKKLLILDDDILLSGADYAWYMNFKEKTKVLNSSLGFNNYCKINKIRKDIILLWKKRQIENMKKNKLSTFQEEKMKEFIRLEELHDK